MLFEKNTLTRENVASGIGGLSTYTKPIKSTLEVQIYRSRISVRIIRTYPFNKSTITWCPAVCDYDLIEGVTLVTVTLQSDFSCHFFLFLLVLYTLQRRKDTSFLGDTLPSHLSNFLFLPRVRGEPSLLRF